MKNNLIIRLFLLLIILITVLVILFILIKNIINSKKKQIENFEVGTEKDIKLNIQTVLIIKENIPFLREWIIYHINIGFDKIYLYDNTGSIGVDGSSNNNNKYNFKFNEIINLNDDKLNQELNDVLTDFKDNIIYVKWQPKNEKGEIIYGQPESIIDYKKKYINTYMDPNIITFTAFIDVDEFILSPSDENIKNLIKKHYIDGVNRIIIKQKKFVDRFCGNKNSNVIDLYDTIENIDTSTWAPKNIINTSVIDEKNILDIHRINITDGNTITLPENILRFNHYNVNKRQIEWMKGYFKRDNFQYGKDTSMSKYKKIIDEKCLNKCSNKSKLIQYDKIDKSLCHKFE